MGKKLKILAAGDLHGSNKIARGLSLKAKKNDVDLVILAGDIYGYMEEKANILQPFTDAKQKVIFVPGNCDFNNDLKILEKSGKNIDGIYVNYEGVSIAGIGNPNWKLWLNYEDLKKFGKNFSKIKSKKKILVSHLHPAGTLAEFSGFPGDEVVRMVTEELKPDLLITAHIHEAEGLEDKINKTKVLQVGRSGKIIEI